MANEGRKSDCRRYYQIAGITIQVDSDLPITDTTFKSKFRSFRVDGKGEDTVIIRHHFSMPDISNWDLGEEIYRETPWAIYRKGDSWIYKGILPGEDDEIWRLAVFSHDHTRVEIYSVNAGAFHRGNWYSLTAFPTDQILLARLLADRAGCYLHSGGVILDGKGLLFTGHSDAGKTTMVTMLKDEAEVLCDDRIIVRKSPDGFRVYGTWSHGDLAQVSANSAPLRAITFLEQASENRLIPISDKREIIRRLLSYLIKPLVTADWWEKTLTVIENLIREVPFYVVRFDKSGDIVDVLRDL